MRQLANNDALGSASAVGGYRLELRSQGVQTRRATMLGGGAARVSRPYLCLRMPSTRPPIQSKEPPTAPASEKVRIDDGVPESSVCGVHACEWYLPSRCAAAHSTVAGEVGAAGHVSEGASGHQPAIPPPQWAPRRLQALGIAGWLIDWRLHSRPWVRPR